MARKICKCSTENFLVNGECVEIKTSKKGMFSQDLFMLCDRKLELTMNINTDGGCSPLCVTQIPIKYCPFCGRKL